MNINLGNQWEAFIAAHVQSGRYLSASEVVRDGLRLLEERERSRRMTEDELLRKLDEGVASLDRGEGHDVSEIELAELAGDIEQRGLRRRNAASQTTD